MGSPRREPILMKRMPWHATSLAFTRNSITMAKPLIEYYKEVLSKISYADQAVFRKEMRKAFRRLVPEEREDLKRWFRSSCVCKTDVGRTEEAASATGAHQGS